MRMSGRERREQLIEVGRTLFADKGFEAVTVEEIASTAGVSKPVVYEHFGGKERFYDQHGGGGGKSPKIKPAQLLGMKKGQGF